MANFVMGMISLVISAIVVTSVVIPVFKNQTFNTTYSNVSGVITPAGMGLNVGELALWGLLSLVTVAGLLYGVLTIFGLT